MVIKATSVFFGDFINWLVNDKNLLGIIVGQMMSMAMIEYTKGFNSSIITPSVSRITMDKDEKKRKYNIRKLLTDTISLIINVFIIYLLSVFVVKKVKKK
jgi:hypothetical protein